MTDAPPGLSVEVLTRFEAFVVIEAEWAALYAAAREPLPYLTHRWLNLSWQLNRGWLPGSVYVILVREAGRLVMAGAFQSRFRHGRRILQFLGSGTPQLNDLLWRDTERTAEHADALLAAVRTLAFGPRWLRTERLTVQSPLRAAVARAGLATPSERRSADFCLRLDAFADYDAYFAARSHNLRVDHRRRLRRLREMPGFAFRLEHGEAARAAIRWCFDAKRDWVEERRKSAPWLVSGRIDRFLLALVDGGDTDTSLYWISTISAGEGIIAAAVCFVAGGVLFYSKIAHDPRFGQHSPGRTLTLLLIEQAFSAGLRAFDFGRGSEEWKVRLGGEPRELVTERIRLR